MTLSVGDLSGFLHGCWSIRRRIADALLARSGRLDGRASFRCAPEGLLYDETGTLRIGTHCGEASQRYLFAMTGPERAEVRFADGRPFHPLDLSSGASIVEHHCGDDRYSGRYRVLDDNRFVVAWHVTGPRKHMRLATRFVRIAPDTSSGTSSPAT